MLNSHKVISDLPADLPLVVLDPVLFEQVLVNLFENAAKYGSDGSEICVRARADGSGVVLQILDEGPGIADADRERIFEKFYRAQKGDFVQAGTGLGLPICRGFIEALHGSIEAGHQNDRTGAVFTIHLPASHGEKVRLS